jgi:hypothetical protein
MTKPCLPVTATQEESAEPGEGRRFPTLFGRRGDRKGWGAQQFQEKMR